MTNTKKPTQKRKSLTDGMNDDYVKPPPKHVNPKATVIDVRAIEKKLKSLRKEYEQTREELRLMNKSIGVREKARKQTHCDKLLETLVFEMAGIASTDEMIEGILGLNKGQINDCKVLKTARQNGWNAGKQNLLSWQFDTARRGSHTMQIWLGKNYLNQVDKFINEVEGDVWESMLLEINANKQAKKEHASHGKAPKSHTTKQGTPTYKAKKKGELEPSERVA
jgi:hypothetical protein